MEMIRISREGLRELLRYPSAVAGLSIIALLILVSLYTVVAIPYRESIALWRGGEDLWIESPRNAAPAWSGIFQGEKISRTIAVDGRRDHPGEIPRSPTSRTVTLSMPFDWPYDGFPGEINLFLTPKFRERYPHLTIHWLTPDGRRIALGERVLTGDDRYSISLDHELVRRLGRRTAELGLFASPEENAEPLTALRGRYELRIEGELFEPESDFDARLVVYGRGHGLAGTDHRRRDLMIALLWGTPIALAFGLLAAVGSTFAALVIAAIGVWYGRWIDAAIQRITEVNSILPTIPILIMVGILYSRSLWVMLGVVVALSIFSLSIKVYRSIFLQVKESPYIEAAKAYGAGDFRIIFLYMLPRVVPVLIPQFVIMIPSFVFLEAALAVLGLGDPVLPTWGKVVNDAYANGALYSGYYYWVVEPLVLLMTTAIGFALVGFALDRILNPRLRTL